MSGILTERFELVPASADVIEALIAGDIVRASDLLSVKFPDGWPLDDEAQAGLPHPPSASLGFLESCTQRR